MSLQMARHPSFSFIFNEERNGDGTLATEVSRGSQERTGKALPHSRTPLTLGTSVDAHTSPKGNQVASLTTLQRRKPVLPE